MKNTVEKRHETVKVKFVGIDDWNRPIFKDIKSKTYYGSTHILFPYYESEDRVLEEITLIKLEYFGSSFNCEPHGGNPMNMTIVIVS